MDGWTQRRDSLRKLRSNHSSSNRFWLPIGKRDQPYISLYIHKFHSARFRHILFWRIFEELHQFSASTPGSQMNFFKWSLGFILEGFSAPKQRTTRVEPVAEESTDLFHDLDVRMEVPGSKVTIQWIITYNPTIYYIPYMGVSKNRGTPKWMVYNGKPLLKWMIWGYHYFRKHPYTIYK